MRKLYIYLSERGEHMKVFANALEMIGNNTHGPSEPSRTTPARVSLYLKLETQNPGASIKRPASLFR